MTQRPGDTVPPEGPGQGSAPRLGVLVVDDDDGVRESLCWILEDAGYRVDSAANGCEALELLGRIELPAVALVDLRMPIMDGAQLIEALRNDPRYADLPVIAFSAAMMTGPPPGVPLLRKPISIDLLLSAVQAGAHGRTS